MCFTLLKYISFTNRQTFKANKLNSQDCNTLFNYEAL